MAIEVPTPALESLVRFQAQLRASGSDLKLVERENLHFTVKFLGEISDTQEAEVKSRLSKLSLASVDVELRGVGAFPKPDRPRVVWAGVSEEQRRAIELLSKEVVDSLEGIGERDDRPFQAHVTLARVRSPRNSRQLEALIRNNSDLPFGKVKLTELKLKSSSLTHSGPNYRDIGVYLLV